jgi:hypothetical protein
MAILVELGSTNMRREIDWRFVELL